MTWETFVERMIPDLTGAQINHILGSTDWNTWIYKSTLAPVELDFSTQVQQDAVQLALDYIILNGTASPDNFKDYFTYYSLLKIVFHSTL